jgi:hypothetical protein
MQNEANSPQLRSGRSSLLCWRTTAPNEPNEGADKTKPIRRYSGAGIRPHRLRKLQNEANSAQGGAGAECCAAGGSTAPNEPNEDADKTKPIRRDSGTGHPPTSAAENAKRSQFPAKHSSQLQLFRNGRISFIPGRGTEQPGTRQRRPYPENEVS